MLFTDAHCWDETSDHLLQSDSRAEASERKVEVYFLLLRAACVPRRSQVSRWVSKIGEKTDFLTFQLNCKNIQQIKKEDSKFRESRKGHLLACCSLSSSQNYSLEIIATCKSRSREAISVPKEEISSNLWQCDQLRLLQSSCKVSYSIQQSVAFGSSCLGSKAHQRAVGGQFKSSCSLSYFPVGSKRCSREAVPFYSLKLNWVGFLKSSCSILFTFYTLYLWKFFLFMPCTLEARTIIKTSCRRSAISRCKRTGVCSFWNFSFKAWAWITRLDRVRCWREVVLYLHILCEFVGREFVLYLGTCVCRRTLLILELLCAQWQS